MGSLQSLPGRLTSYTPASGQKTGPNPNTAAKRLRPWTSPAAGRPYTSGPVPYFPGTALRSTEPGVGSTWRDKRASARKPKPSAGPLLHTPILITFSEILLEQKLQALLITDTRSLCLISELCQNGSCFICHHNHTPISSFTFFCTRSFLAYIIRFGIFFFGSLTYPCIALLKISLSILLIFFRTSHIVLSRS